MELFKKYQSNLDINCNLKIVDYLDKTFDSDTVFKSLSTNPIASHYALMQAQITHHLCWNRFPNLYQKWLPLSLAINIFSVSAPFYNSILLDGGSDENIKYYPEELVSSRRGKNRSRNIIWYNTPFSRNVKTNVGKDFFKSLKKHFRKNHKYHKILRKTI